MYLASLGFRIMHPFHALCTHFISDITALPPSRPFPSSLSPLPSLLGSPGFTRRICSVIAQDNCILRYCLKLYDYCSTDAYRPKCSFFPRTVVLILIFFIQAEPYIGITPGCAASESGVTSPELLIMFPYGNLERF